MLTCPTCATTNVDVTLNGGAAAGPRWHVRCLDCGNAWDLEDV